MVNLLRRGTRLMIDTAVGYVLLIAGVVMLLTPGPGIVAAGLGLAVLSRHYRWAHRAKLGVLRRVRDTGAVLRGRRVGGLQADVTTPESDEPVDEAA